MEEKPAELLLLLVGAGLSDDVGFAVEESFWGLSETAAEDPEAFGGETAVDVAALLLLLFSG